MNHTTDHIRKCISKHTIPKKMTIPKVHTNRIFFSPEQQQTSFPPPHTYPFHYLNDYCTLLWSSRWTSDNIIRDKNGTCIWSFSTLSIHPTPLQLSQQITSFFLSLASPYCVLEWNCERCSKKGIFFLVVCGRSFFSSRGLVIMVTDGHCHHSVKVRTPVSQSITGAL